MKRHARALLFLLAACGSKDEPKSNPPPVASKSVDAAPKPAAPDAAPVVKPATADTPTDLAPTLAGYTITAPAGATVTPDAPHFNETKSTGVTVTKDAWTVHVWAGTIGGEREAMATMASAMSQKYVEGALDTKGHTFEYTIDGKPGYISAAGDVLCGTAEPGADAAAVDAAKQACTTLTKKK